MSGRRHKTIVPVPCVGGTSATLLLLDRKALRDSIRDTIRRLEAIEPHVRDYAATPDIYTQAVKQHQRRWNQLLGFERAVLEEIELLADARARMRVQT